MDLNNLFGEKNWDDVRVTLMKRVSRRWTRMPKEDVEDAVSEALLDLVNYWVDLDSSISTDPVRNYHFALRRGYWVATSYLVKRYKRYGKEVPAEVFQNNLDDYEGSGAASFIADPVDPDPNPEELYVLARDMEKVREAIGSIPAEQREEWFDAFITGLTKREAAELEKTSPSQVQRRRAKGLRTLAAQVGAA